MANAQIQQQLECPVCLEQFRAPKQLPCQHIFCQQCLEGIARSNSGPNVICPECRQAHQIPSNGIAGFPTSVVIQRLLEAMTQPNVPQPQPQPSAPPPQIQTTERPALSRGNTGFDNEDLEMARYLSILQLQEQLGGHVTTATTQRNSQTAQGVQNITATQRTQENRRTEHGRNGLRGDAQRNPDRIEINRESNNQSRDNLRNGGEDVAISYQCLRRTYRRGLGIVFEKQTVNILIVSLLLLLTIARFIAGAVKLSSECKDEYNVAVYLFVKAWFGFLLYVNLLVFSWSNIIKRALDNLFVQIWLILHAMFTIIWFLIGTAWVFGNYADMKKDCPNKEEDWNFHFINFAVFLTAVDWVGTVIFVFYLLYHLCDRGNDDNDSN